MQKMQQGHKAGDHAGASCDDSKKADEMEIKQKILQEFEDGILSMSDCAKRY
jgi:hypothetical protein